MLWGQLLPTHRALAPCPACYLQPSTGTTSLSIPQGAAGKTSTAPLETVKMQVVQSRSLGTLEAVQTIFRRGGLRGFFRSGKGEPWGKGAMCCLLSSGREGWRSLHWPADMPPVYMLPAGATRSTCCGPSPAAGEAGSRACFAVMVSLRAVTCMARRPDLAPPDVTTLPHPRRCPLQHRAQHLRVPEASAAVSCCVNGGWLACSHPFLAEEKKKLPAACEAAGGAPPTQLLTHPSLQLACAPPQALEPQARRRAAHPRRHGDHTGRRPGRCALPTSAAWPASLVG